MMHLRSGFTEANRRNEVRGEGGESVERKNEHFGNRQSTPVYKRRPSNGTMGAEAVKEGRKRCQY